MKPAAVMSLKLTICFVLPLVCTCPAADSVATVGDSFADTFYYGMHSRPDLLRQYDIHLVRWSRPMIGLTRTDQFDYTGWLRESDDLGAADYCLVQLGANDLQSIPAGPQEWVRFPEGDWKLAYAGRVRGMVDVLRANRCRRLIWVLLPGFERSPALGRNRDMINRLQLTGLGGSNALIFEIEAGAGDYGRDGIHFNGPFALKLGEAVMRTVSAWRARIAPDCHACHSEVKMRAPAAAANMMPLRLYEGSAIDEPPAPILSATSARSVTPPSPVVRVARTQPRAHPARRHRRKRAGVGAK